MRTTLVFGILAAALLLLLPFGLTVGGVELTVSQIVEALRGGDDAVTRYIVVENRLPALITAILSGAALSVAGLLMQTCFNNPLAGPSIMGISSGSSLGVALVMMFAGGIAGAWGNLAVITGALAGAFVVLILLTAVSAVLRSGDALLIAGILIGYLASSVISLLSFFSSAQGVHGYVMWGLGSFSTVGLDRLPLLAVLSLALLAASALYIRSLNALLMGERFASNVGISVRRVRTGLLALSGALTAVVTAWCGPIGFIGLVVPQVARISLRSSNHAKVLPATALCGAVAGLLCQIISVAPTLSEGGAIPLNAITPVLGVPVIIYVLLNRRRLLYFQ
ncbi:MAG: iron ABC transporter permease [Bacteroidales bacterium]|nr:iron ABC transporter permease [Bacteroidales bacterium]